MSAPLLDPAALGAARILVVAPHADDESLGCGGLLWHMARLGRAVHVVFVTDGGASHRKSATWPRPRLAAEREREAAEALAILGLAGAPRSFLRLADAAMPAPGSPEHAAALEAARGIVRSFRPDLALLPWRRDPHCDHRDAWSLFSSAFEADGARPDILEYAIWLDEIGAPEDHPRAGEMEGLRFGIGEALSPKRRAVEAHRTQTGALIADDPDAFRLTRGTIDRLVGPVETYWRAPA